MTTPRVASSLLLSAILLLTPLAIWAQRSMSETWTERLAIPQFEPQINRHTPLHTNGTFLISAITKDLTLTPANNPVIISSEVRIPSDVTVTISAGTNIVAHEFASLIIDGQLNINGTADQPVTLTTNELHPDNQIWGGLNFSKESTGHINHAFFNFASPAISCLDQSHVTIKNVKVRDAIAGAIIESDNCSIESSSISALRDGVTVINSSPAITNSTITGTHKDIAVFEN